jgi:hypothetical protein
VCWCCGWCSKLIRRRHFVSPRLVNNFCLALKNVRIFVKMINYIFRRHMQGSYMHNDFFIRPTRTLIKFTPICQCSMLKLGFPKITSKCDDLVSKSTKRDVCRYFSSDGGPPSNKLPPLMDFPKITWPSLMKSIRNFILATFIIKPYFDRDFNLPDFVAGSKKAVEVCNV